MPPSTPATPDSAAPRDARDTRAHAPRPPELAADSRRATVARVVAPGELTAQELATWRRITTEDPLLDRPFFAPEYTDILARHRDGIEVAVLADGDETIGFLPFRRSGGTGRTRRGGAEPIGGRLDDFQGPILPAAYSFDLRDALPACPLGHFRLDHRLQRCASDAHGATTHDSPNAALPEGFESYFAAKKESGAGWTKQVPRKGRKLAREHGTLRFILDSDDPAHFACMRRWKAQQRKRTHTIDPLDSADLAAAVETIHHTRTPDFAGILSVLLVDETPVAVHFGMKTRRTLHIWFPTYDPTFERFSPGMLLLLDLLREAAAEGVTRIDFGRGPARYKESLRTGGDRVLEAHVDVRPVGRAMRAAIGTTRGWVKRSPIADWVRGPRRRVRRWLADRRKGDA